jgi:hypothetical protein
MRHIPSTFVYSAISRPGTVNRSGSTRARSIALVIGLSTSCEKDFSAPPARAARAQIPFDFQGFGAPVTLGAETEVQESASAAAPRDNRSLGLGPSLAGTEARPSDIDGRHARRHRELTPTLRLGYGPRLVRSQQLTRYGIEVDGIQAGHPVRGAIEGPRAATGRMRGARVVLAPIRVREWKLVSALISASDRAVRRRKSARIA